MKKLSSARWNTFANVFANHIVGKFSNGHEFTTKDVKMSITEELETEYKKCLTDWQAKGTRHWNWHLVDFDRVNRWLAMLVDNDIIDMRHRKPGEKHNAKFRNLYKVVGVDIEKEYTMKSITPTNGPNVQAEIITPADPTEDDKVCSCGTVLKTIRKCTFCHEGPEDSIEERLTKAEKRIKVLENVNETLSKFLRSRYSQPL